ncbi:MAG: hypothetical protein WAK82_02620 [Streptosporangiaceae bacterium]
MATRGTDGPGEVLVKIRGGSEAFLAWSETPLPKGATVLVIESRGARAVDVIEWEDVLGDSPRIPGLPAVRGDERRCSAIVCQRLMRRC